MSTNKFNGKLQGAGAQFSAPMGPVSVPVYAFNIAPPQVSSEKL
jgi:hypothetical protein